MTTRRQLFIALGAGALAWADTLFGQSAKPQVVIGWLSWGSRKGGERLLDVFKFELAALGWKEGSQFVLEGRWADGHADRLPALAADLAASKPALIIAQPVPPARAAAKAAPKTPIIVIGGDPVSAGLVASHARPGGMITGLTSVNTEISEKYLELLLAAAPKLRRVAFLFDLNAANVAVLKENARRSAERRSVETLFADISRLDEIEPALARLAREGANGLIVPASANTWRLRIGKFALTQRWPVVGGAGWAVDGGVISYSADYQAIYRRAAQYADRILRGTKPADLPVERPTKFVLVVNLKTAKALGLTIPPAIMVQATRVIE
jgi:putative ABC transport system substrate-binding protein